jgi:GntR family transcriptional repressor for pyruvate dehydrogenase complex
MGLTLKPIKPKRISDQVFDQLRELIFRGEMKPGKQIMPERELAQALEVSRTTVRDAISKLVVMGFLEQKQGQGTFVRSRDSIENNPFAVAMDAQQASLEELLEVRMGLECHAAALAARRADEKDIRFLEKSIADMKVEVESGRLGTEADVSFHMALCYATKNPVQIHLMKDFFDFLFVGIKENLKHLYENPTNINRIVTQHAQIYHAIKNHNAKEAFAAMQNHIAYVLDFFRKHTPTHA